MDMFSVLFPSTAAQLTRIEEKEDQIMAQVKVNQEDLDSLDTSLDEVASNLAAHIDSLNLPDGDLSALREDVEALRGLSAPSTGGGSTEEPPAPNQDLPEEQP